ncbi:DOMON domain-containing protein [Ekhidna sp.]|uniref:DOMON domain-containing protein n=1 Tax=Ekhidna sp. TaxID=2608089 RepID=UPI0032973AF0
MKYLILFSLMFMVPSTKKLETEGFVLEWTHATEHIQISISAPSTGWVAVGFTTGSSIVNTNLIQGHVSDGEVFIQDQFVTDLGEHPPVEALAVAARIFDLCGEERNGTTTLKFSIYKTKVDNLHCDLAEGNTINVWLAYSLSDDFDHHSRKRILRRIIL